MAGDPREYLFVNDGQAALAGSISSSSTSISVVDGSSLPDPSPTQVSTLVMKDDVGGKFEIMHLTDRASNTLTVERGREGTTAVGWGVGEIIRNAVTAGFLQKLQGDVTVPVEDPEDTLLLLHFDGVDGTTTIVDSSFYARTVTNNSNNVQHDTSDSVFGGSSGQFFGSGNRLSVPSDAAFNFGTTDFSIDFWIRTGSVSGSQTLISKQGFSTLYPFAVQLLSGGSVRFLGGQTITGSTAYSITSTADIDDNVWHHVECGRAGDTFYLFIDGVLDYSPSGLIDTYSGELASNATDVFIGGDASLLGNITGRLDELRITRLPPHTANFTPPTAPYGGGT